MAVPNPKRLLTVDEFQALAESGYFSPDERLELIRGEIVEMMPIGDPHALCVMLLNDAFADLRPTGIVNPQNPLRLPQQRSVPQPDIVSSGAGRTSSPALRVLGTPCWSWRSQTPPLPTTATSKSLSMPRAASVKPG
jgi:Uma2 family endonuclease